MTTCPPTACQFPGQPGAPGHINACKLCPNSPTYWRNQPAAATATRPAATAPIERQPRTELDWSKHATGTPAPCRHCGQPAHMRDAQGQPCHKVCAEQTVEVTR